ncbi:hypothetical protein [[Mycoplasma] mobile]|nr:hypothetical protein [[Mycoplasma] mobile]
METKKILIVARTYSNRKLLEEIIKKESPNFLIHAGNHEEEIGYMEKYFNQFVNGENDNFDTDLSKIFNVFNFSFHLESNLNLIKITRSNIEKYTSDLAIKSGSKFFIFSNSDEPSVKNEGTIFILNPGSIVKSVWNKFIGSYILVFINGESISVFLKNI